MSQVLSRVKEEQVGHGDDDHEVKIMDMKNRHCEVEMKKSVIWFSPVGIKNGWNMATWLSWFLTIEKSWGPRKQYCLGLNSNKQKLFEYHNEMF